VFKPNTTLLMELLVMAAFYVAMTAWVNLICPPEAEAGDTKPTQPQQVAQGASPKTTPPQRASAPKKPEKSPALKAPVQPSPPVTQHPSPNSHHATSSTQPSPSRKAARRPAPPSSSRFCGTIVEPLKTAPFPLVGKESDPNFFDFVDSQTGERFRTSRTLERLSEKDHYRDNSVLFHVPPQFDPNKPFSYVVFFHGNRTEVRQALKDYRFDDQINRSGKNVILVLPQLAKNAADSSPGRFAKRNAFQAFMQEVSLVLSQKLGKKYQKQLTQAPIILAAFSGGYKPLACTLDRGGTDLRIKGILLLDGLYEDLYIFGKWLLSHANATFFINIYTEGSVCQDKTIALAQFLREHRLPFKEEWPKGIKKGQVVLLRSSYDHLQVPVEGPPREPLAELLRSLKQ
jgi:hypothetical protein